MLWAKIHSLRVHVGSADRCSVAVEYKDRRVRTWYLEQGESEVWCDGPDSLRRVGVWIGRDVVFPVDLIESLNDPTAVGKKTLKGQRARANERSAERMRTRRAPHLGVLRMLCFVRFAMSSVFVDPVQVQAIVRYWEQ